MDNGAIIEHGGGIQDLTVNRKRAEYVWAEAPLWRESNSCISLRSVDSCWNRHCPKTMSAKSATKKFVNASFAFLARVSQPILTQTPADNSTNTSTSATGAPLFAESPLQEVLAKASLQARLNKDSGRATVLRVRLFLVLSSYLLTDFNLQSVIGELQTELKKTAVQTPEKEDELALKILRKAIAQRVRCGYFLCRPVLIGLV